MATVKGVKLMKDGEMVFPITHINAVKNESGQNLSNILGGKANSSHTHDDRYYTESEIDSKVSALNSAINGKANSSHSHSSYQVATNFGSDTSGTKTLASISVGQMGYFYYNMTGSGSVRLPSGGTYLVMSFIKPNDGNYTNCNHQNSSLGSLSGGATIHNIDEYYDVFGIYVRKS